MKKALLAFGMLLMTGTAANAGGLTSRLSSSVQLTVDAAATNAVRMGNSYSVSGSNVTTTGGLGGLGTLTSGVADTPSIPTATQATSGEAFSFSNSFTQGDALPTSLSVGAVAPYGDVTSTAAGTAGTLGGSIDTTGAVSVTAGGAGTSAIGQFVSEISVFE